MNTMTNGNRVKNFFRKFAFLMDEAVWTFTLVGLVVLALVDGALSIGGGTIA